MLYTLRHFPEQFRGLARYMEKGQGQVQGRELHKLLIFPICLGGAKAKWDPSAKPGGVCRWAWARSRRLLCFGPGEG